MKLISILLFCLLICSFANCFKATEAQLKQLTNFLPKNVTGRKYCPTEDIWKWKKAMINPSASSCLEGICDQRGEREKYNSVKMDIKLWFIVVCSNSGIPPSGVDTKIINDQMKQIEKDFANTKIKFKLAGFSFVEDSTYTEISAYNPYSSTWYNQINNMKNKYSTKPTEYLYVFVTNQRAGSYGTLLGIGTFPWDPSAKQRTGGLWMNAKYVGYGETTTSHEIGHCLGLWHTFHGVDEVDGCSDPCHEGLHSLTDDAANFVGDLCSDTPAQPRSYECAVPPGNNCGQSWTQTSLFPSIDLVNNLMAYTPDTCQNQFTPQQDLRASCWVCNELPNWVETKCQV